MNNHSSNEQSLSKLAPLQLQGLVEHHTRDVSVWVQSKILRLKNLRDYQINSHIMDTYI